MVEGRLGRRYTLYLFSGLGKAHGKRPVTTGGRCLRSENLAVQHRGKALRCTWSVYMSLWEGGCTWF